MEFDGLQVTPVSKPSTPSDTPKFSLFDDSHQSLQPNSEYTTQPTAHYAKNYRYQSESQLDATCEEHHLGSNSGSPCDTKITDPDISISSSQSLPSRDDPDFILPSSQKPKLKPVDEEELTVEERFDRLNALLERSGLFTEVVGRQVRKQQKKRKKRMEAEQKSESLRNLVLSDISPRLRNVENNSNLDSTEDSEPASKKHRGDEVASVNKSNENSHNCFKPVEVRYFNKELIPPEQPKLLTGGVLRNYQVDGFDWMRILYENGINGILADEMGLGKTIQAISIICHLIERGVNGPFLVLAPLSTLRNWQREFARFAPTVYTTVYNGSKSTRDSILETIKARRPSDPTLLSKANKRPVVIMHYELIRLDFRKLCKIAWSYTVLDEGHKIKNSKTSTNRLLNKMLCENSLILTGTPFQNNLPELWSLLSFLMPAIFGNDRNTFQHWFDVRGNLRDEVIDREKQMPIVEIMQKIIRPFIMRRMKSDVELNLPPKKEILVYCPLTRIQKNFYRAILDRTIMSIVREEYSIEEELRNESEGANLRGRSRGVDYKEMSDEEFTKIVNGETVLPLTWTGEVVKVEKPDLLPVHISISAQKANIHLRKVVNHPYLVAHPYDQLAEGKALIISEETVEISGKMRILDKMLNHMIPKGHKILIYSQWVRILDLVQDLMEMREIKHVRLDGSRDLANREDSIDQFQTDVETKCFLITTRAGGLGINLTAADTVIIFDSDWNPHVDQQAQDRCHRIGQTLPVIVYRLVAAHTIDQKLVERAYNKKKLDKILINNKGFCKNSWTQNKITSVSVEDLQELLTELEYDTKIGEGEDFTEEQIEALLNRDNLIEGVTNEMYRVISNHPQANEV